MNQTDFYTGEPINFGSPQNFNSEASDIEAANMASFGKYDYDPANRQGSIYPGGAGYTAPGTAVSPIQPIYYPPTNQGIGAVPPGYTPYGNVQPSYGQFRNYQQQPQYQQPTTYTVPGINIFGTYMPPEDIDRQITDMGREFWAEQQDLEVGKIMQQQNSAYGFGGGFGYNYYGIPYFNPYQYNALNNKYASRAEELKNQARNNALEFSMHISKLAHSFVKDGISDEDIRERYTGKTVDIPTGIMPTPQEYYEQNRLYNLEPFDNSNVYREHRAAVQKKFRDIIPEDSNLKETSEKMAIVWADWELEDEMHRRKDAGALYNSGDNSYKYFVRKKAQERYAKEHGIATPAGDYNGQNGFYNPQNLRQSFVNSLPSLSQNATLADDGTLNVSLKLPCNVGSHAGEEYTVHNSQESEYDEKRERFSRFLDSIPGNIYLDQQKQKKLEEYSYD
jgi:hypothetical protein